MINLKKVQSGETIIEVLIAIMILSAILAGAFAISNRSQKTVQANQERSQAQSIANEQADLIRETSMSSPAEITGLTEGQTFCIKAANASVANLPADAAECKRNQSGARADDGMYEITVTAKKGPGDVVNTFIIKVTWDSFINRGKDTVEVLYGI